MSDASNTLDQQIAALESALQLPPSLRIGSVDDDPDAGDAEQPQHTVTFDAPFWIARYLITNAQWRDWVEQADGKRSYSTGRVDLNRPNQPVVSVTWHWCNDFCTWLSEQFGMTVRLLTEQEWEAAAPGGDTRRYPWGEWLNDRAATEEDQETRGARYPVPVGCYPAGAAACGALDMAGNAWEWTASAYCLYPGAAKHFTDEDKRVLRGGSWGDSRNRVRCGARLRFNPVYASDDYIGFRVVVPRLVH
jgi:formylglycine-generating enzyme required for sulfatase activity